MVELFINGGNFMWPILGIFIVGLVFVGERLMHLISSSKWGEDFSNEVTNTLNSSGALEAQTICEQGQGPIANLLLTIREQTTGLEAPQWFIIIGLVGWFVSSITFVVLGPDAAPHTLWISEQLHIGMFLCLIFV